MFKELPKSEIGSELGLVVGVSCLSSKSSCLRLQQHDWVGFTQKDESKDRYNSHLVKISGRCPLRSKSFS